mgnify:CR=1 FL=1
MNKPDLLITWHESNDYPPFRATLRKHRDFFGKIIIYLSKHFREPVYADFLKESMRDLGNIVFLDPIEYQYGVEDWRHVSTTYMLKHSNSEWVTSVEQDWFAKDWDKMLEATDKAMKEADMVGWMNETAHSYIHPSYWFIKRDLLESLGTDFKPHSEIVGSDHFAMMTYKAQERGVKIVTLQDLGFDCNFRQEADAFHLGGVNQNYLNFEELFEAKTIHRAEAFFVYNRLSMSAPVQQSKEFLDRCAHVDHKLSEIFPNYSIEASGWKEFFK